MKPEALAKSPVTCEAEAGALESWLVLDSKASVFDQHSLLRKALLPLLEEHPSEIDIAVYGAASLRLQVAEAAVYVAWLNGAALPDYKTKKKAKPLARIRLHGCLSPDGFARARALAEGNVMTRELTMLPPNELTPRSYRQRIAVLARREGWGIEELDIKKLRKLKAGAFLAVARGSQHEDAAIVHLSYAPKKTKGHYALVGKGICFDTGGHNLKPARYMHNMHDDMNGSAVGLGLLLAATRLKLPLRLDVWLAIAQNHLSPEAYTQNEVITALNGTTIEIVHTDAEGRMVLADTLTLAAKAKPAAILDFATLTGSMAVAVGERMSGVLANRDELAATAVAAGAQCGERVVAFPVPEDYDEALESKVADVKQCTLDGEADHILAARLLNRFVADTPWLHVDLSASRCKGGLGAVASDITGFGVGLGLGVLERLAG
ncbi:MAG: leucyl aminopeptidase family protein [Hydrogenophilaceae bacterium]|nr:leucyl aminopeptidase family protein [Hydrogenophilaceae bacterium]